MKRMPGRSSWYWSGILGTNRHCLWGCCHRHVAAVLIQNSTETATCDVQIRSLATTRATWVKVVLAPPCGHPAGHGAARVLECPAFVVSVPWPQLPLASCCFIMFFWRLSIQWQIMVFCNYVGYHIQYRLHAFAVRVDVRRLGYAQTKPKD